MRYNIKGEIIDENDPCYKEHGTYYEAHYSCSDCSYTFSVVSGRKPTGRCPACPKCRKDPRSKGLDVIKGRLKTEKQLQENRRRIIESRTMPSIGGRNVGAKAHDQTMKMVMEDYGLTNINDKPYEGENCVPKLAPHLEKQVNDGFGASFGNVIPKLTGNIDPAQVSSVGLQQIHSGKFRDQGDVVAMQQRHGPKPKFRIINE